MPFKLGATEASAVKLGTVNLSKLMLGETQVWPTNPPGPPTGAAATVDVDDVTVTWIAPVFTGDTPITDYVIQRGSLIAFEDDFNRADNSDLGANWTPAGEYGPLRIVSNKVKAITSGATAVEECQTAAPSNDQWGMVTVNVTGDTFIGLLLRGTGSGGSRAEVGFEIDDHNRFDLVEFIAGEHITRVRTSDESVPNGVDLTLRGELIGDQAYYYVNGSLMLQATLTTQLAGTRVRFGCTDQSGSATTTFDNFRMGGYVATTWTTVTDAVSTATSAVLVNEPAGRWVYRVMAVNAGGNSVASAQSNSLFIGIDSGAAVPTAPIAPTAVVGTAADSQVALTWTAPASNGGSAITDYVVQRALQSAPTVWTTFTDAVSTATAATVTGLTNATAYIFRVAAVNAIGQGSYSTPSAAYTPVAGLTVPDAPTGLASTPGSGQVALTWTAPASNGGSAITDYVIQYRPATGGSTPAPDRSDNFNRADGTIVTPWSQRTAGTWTVDTNTARPSAVGADSLIQHSTRSDAIGYVQATVRADDAYAGIMSLIESPYRNEVYFLIHATTHAYQLGHQINSVDTPLDQGGFYDVGDTVELRLEWEIGASTTALRGYVDDVLTCEGVSSKHPAGAYGVGIGAYQVSSSVFALDDWESGTLGAAWSTFSDAVSTATGATVTGLTNGTAYEFQVAAVNAIGQGIYSAIDTETPAGAATVPGAPTGLAATAGNAQVALTWVAPASNGGSAITDYVVQYRTTAGPGSWNTFSEGTSTTAAATVTGLANGMSYDFQVAAVNSVGTGSYSATDTETPSGTVVPGVPTALDAVAGDTQAVLTWTAPMNGQPVQIPTCAADPDNEGSTVYEGGMRVQFARAGQVTGIRYKRRNVSTAALTFKAWRDSTQTKVAEVSDTRSTTGQYEVSFPTPVPVNAGESWTFAIASSAAFLPRNSALQTVTETAYVDWIEFRSSGAYDTYPSTVASFSTYYAEPIFEPGDPTITDYTVQWRTTAGPGSWNTFSEGTSAATGATVTGLTNGTSYDFQVAAVNAIGTGSYSATDTATPASPWPILAASNSEAGAVLGAANAIPAPSGVAAGNLLLAVGVNDNPSTTDLSGSTGWTRISHTVQGSNVLKLGVFARIADGGANDAFALTGASQDYCVTIHRITNHAVVDVATDLHIAAFASTSNGNADPPNLAPGTARHYLWLTAAGVDATTSNTITGVPSGYTQVGSTLTSASTTSSCLLAVAQKNADTTSDNPGTFTNTSRPFIAVTIAIPKDVVAPAAPTLNTPTPASGQVALTWTPGATGGSAITDYIVQYRTTAGPGSWNTFSEGTSTTAAATVTGLTDGTSYDFQVATVTAAGTSAYSATQTATPNAAGGGPTGYVKGNTGYNTGPATLNGVVAGNCVAVWVSGNSTLTGTSLPAGFQKQPPHNFSDAAGCWWIYPNHPGGNVSAAITGPPGDCGWSILEHSGVHTTTPVDDTDQTNGTGTTWTTPAVTATAGGAVLIGVSQEQAGHTITVTTSGFTRRTGQDSQVHMTCSAPNVAAGPVTATGSVAPSSASWVATVVALKSA